MSERCDGQWPSSSAKPTCNAFKLVAIIIPFRVTKKRMKYNEKGKKKKGKGKKPFQGYTSKYNTS